ncbi:hypothetical protein [Streptomyces lydicamycinicus]|nr:hypothetical protein [Streptomyces lydicamycinicus]
MTIYVGNGGTVNNTFTSAPAVGPVAVPPQGPPATHRTWLTPGVIAAAMLFVIAGACGLLSLSYAPLERMAQVMTGVATTTGALTAIGPAITTALRRHTNYQ